MRYDTTHTVVAQGLDEARQEHWRVVTDFDNDPISPREADNAWTLVCAHRRGEYGDQQITRRDEDGRPSLALHLKDQGIKLSECFVRPIYAYEHGGLTISTSPYNDRFDSGQLGEAFIPKAKAFEEWGVDEHGQPRSADAVLACALKALDGEVEDYAAYLEGQVFELRYEIQPATREPDGSWADPDDHNWDIEECLGSYLSDQWRDNGMFESLPESVQARVLAQEALAAEPAQAPRKRLKR